MVHCLWSCNHSFVLPYVDISFPGYFLSYAHNHQQTTDNYSQKCVQYIRTVIFHIRLQSLYLYGPVVNLLSPSLINSFYSHILELTTHWNAKDHFVCLQIRARLNLLNRHVGCNWLEQRLRFTLRNGLPLEQTYHLLPCTNHLVVKLRQ